MIFQSHGGGRRVLIVDDELDILEEYVEFFELCGIPVLTESCPAAAKAKVLNDPTIDVVVTDLRMAPLDGLQLIRDLRAELGARSVRFLILSGLCNDLVRDIDLGEVPVLSKPVDLEAFRAAVVEAMSPR